MSDSRKSLIRLVVDAVVTSSKRRMAAYLGLIFILLHTALADLVVKLYWPDALVSGVTFAEVCAAILALFELQILQRLLVEEDKWPRLPLRTFFWGFSIPLVFSFGLFAYELHEGWTYEPYRREAEKAQSDNQQMLRDLKKSGFDYQELTTQLQHRLDQFPTTAATMMSGEHDSR